MQIKIIKCRDCGKTLISPIETKCKNSCRWGTVEEETLDIPDDYIRDYIKKLEAES